LKLKEYADTLGRGSDEAKNLFLILGFALNELLEANGGICPEVTGDDPDLSSSHGLRPTVDEEAAIKELVSRAAAAGLPPDQQETYAQMAVDLIRKNAPKGELTESTAPKLLGITMGLSASLNATGFAKVRDKFVHNFQGQYVQSKGAEIQERVSEGDAILTANFIFKALGSAGGRDLHHALASLQHETERTGRPVLRQSMDERLFSKSALFRVEGEPTLLSDLLAEVARAGDPRQSSVRPWSHIFQAVAAIKAWDFFHELKRKIRNNEDGVRAKTTAKQGKKKVKLDDQASVWLAELSMRSLDATVEMCRRWKTYKELSKYPFFLLLMTREHPRL
jgi:hypothetical protein